MRRGHTLVEVLVAAGVFLLMSLAAGAAVIGFLRSYRQYTDRGLQVRLQAKCLEATCRSLRGAVQLKAPAEAVWRCGFSLSETPVRFVDAGGTEHRLGLEGKRVLLDKISLGPGDPHLEVTGNQRTRRLFLQVGDMRTELSLWGVRW